MCYQQDSVERQCAICDRAIRAREWMTDLDREKGGRVRWLHVACMRRLSSWWLGKKAQKTGCKTLAAEQLPLPLG